MPNCNFCTSCGWNVEPEWSICGYCGQRLDCEVHPPPSHPE